MPQRWPADKQPSSGKPWLMPIGVLSPESASFAGGCLRFPGPSHARAPRNPSLDRFPSQGTAGPRRLWGNRNSRLAQWSPFGQGQLSRLATGSASNCSVEPWWSGRNGILSAAINSRWVAVGLEPPVAAARPPADRITADDRQPRSPYLPRDPTVSFRQPRAASRLCVSIPWK